MIRKTICLAILGALFIVPAADARKPRPKPDNVYAGSTDQGAPGYVKVLSHGRGLEVVFAYGASCSDGEGGVFWRGVTGLSVRKGRFHYSRTEDASGPEVTLDGKMGKKSVSGTWHVSFSFPDPSGSGATVTCDSGLVTWTLQKSAFGGQTSAGYPLAADVKKGKVRVIEIATELKCQSGASYFWATPYDNFTIAPSGSFGDSFEDAGPGPDNGHLNVTVELHGKVGKTKITGTWHVVAKVFDATGNQVDTCDSGPLTWSMAP